MKFIFFIFVTLVSLIFSGCMNRAYAPSYTYRGVSGGAYGAPQYTQRERTPHRGRVYSSRVNITGDVSYVDRKYFKQTLEDILRQSGIEEDYNSPNKIDIRIIKSVDKTKTSGGDSYQNCSAFQINQVAQGAILYTIRGKLTYNDTINYKFTVNSASCVSYDDAELKARKKLYRRLGEITASRLVNLKSKLLRDGANCRIRR